jgi:hypothetical protein
VLGDVEARVSEPERPGGIAMLARMVASFVARANDRSTRCGNSTGTKHLAEGNGHQMGARLLLLTFESNATILD